MRTIQRNNVQICLKLMLICLISTVSAGPAVEAPPVQFNPMVAAQQRGDEINEFCVYGQGTAYNTAFFIALAGSFEASLAAYALNLGLKGCAPILDKPADIRFNPGPGNCSIRAIQTREVEYRNNILGVPTSRDYNWGALGTPTTFHWNTSTRVDFNTIGTGITTNLMDEYTVPMGDSYLQWTAETLVAPIDFVFIYIPGLPKGVEKYLGGPAGREAAEFILNVGIELGKFPLGTALSEIFDPFPSGALNRDFQRISVLDLVAPWFTPIGSQNFTFEAVDIGGTTFDSLNVATNLSNGDVLRSAFTVEDNCDGNVELIPEKGFWPLNEITPHVWTAKDDGPNLDDEENETTFTQIIEVVDTLPPIIVAPPGLAVERELEPDNTTVLFRFDIGVPRVFDLGDPDIAITVEGVEFFADQFDRQLARVNGGINEVVWTATDTSGNTASATQIVNVKAPGTNQLPFAVPRSASAQTFEFELIGLQGIDDDLDPLRFEIETPPANGFFKSPLLPFFIEDFRLPKLNTNCDTRPPEQVALPSYVTTTDEGITYVLDNSTDQYCAANNEPDARHRIAIYDANGQYQNHRNLPRRADLFGLKVHPERDEVIYTAYDPINVRRPIIYRFDDETLQTVQQYTMEAEEWGSVNSANISDDNVLYLSTGCDRLWVFDLNDAIPLNPIANYLPGTSQTLDYCSDSVPSDIKIIRLCEGNFCVQDDRNVARDINFTADGDILVSTAHRLFRIKKPTRNADGDLILSNDIKWLGRCSGGSGCDISKGASFGFTCEDGVSCSGGGQPGSGQGQFYQMSGIDVDPNGNIYTADWGQFVTNGSRGRIQRFSPEGFYAGEAKSSCPTDSRCFVLGDFSRPRAIGVNSDQLFVVDEKLDLIHVFQTSVISPSELGDDLATVMYSSNEGFTGTDTFTYTVRDGFPDSASAPATVTINVSRNFRPPVSESVTLQATEDEVRSSIMLSTDPDGSLDTLTFTVVEPPQHGTVAFDGPVNGLGQPYTYTPDPDFEGSDSFTFISNDGLEDSNVATVSIEVAAVNDAPVISLSESGVANRSTSGDQSVTIARGYETDFTFRVDEIDAVDLYFVTVDFGDGSPMAFEDDITDGSIDGVALLPDLFGADLVTQHTYTSDADLEVCVTDNVVIVEGIKIPTATSITVCESFAISAVPMADVQIAMDGSRVVSEQQNTLTLEVVMNNRVALDSSALDATNLTSSLMVDSRLTLVDWVNPAGGLCSPNGQSFDCNINNLPQGGETRIQVTLAFPGDRQIGDAYLLMVEANADQDDPLVPNAAALEISVAPISDIIVNVGEDETTSCALLCGDSGQACPDVGDIMPQCSLRSALQLANGMAGEQSIGLGNLTYRVDPDIGEWFVFDDVRLQGSGADRSILSGMNADRVLNITSGQVAHIQGLTLRDGLTEFSGGGLAISPNADVTLEDVLITNNQALSGGGIHHRGSQLNMSRVSITNNQARSSDISSASGAGLLIGGDALMQNSTVSGNQSEISGGGITVIESAELDIFNSTITDNVSSVGAGGLVLNSGTRVDMYLSILSGNQESEDTGLSPNDCTVGGNAQFTSFGYNLLGQFCGNGNGLDVLTTNPQLKALGNYGGPTPTHEPLPESPAIDIGLTQCETSIDQRGQPRPVDGNMDGMVLCDSGAVEYLLVDELFANGFE